MQARLVGSTGVEAISGLACARPVGNDDEDGDGVPDGDDLCLDTVIPEWVPTKVLKKNKWALVDKDGIFDSGPSKNKDKDKGPDPFMIEDTRGCSCDQIIGILELGKGHEQHGCSTGAMEEFIELVNE